MKVSLDEFDNAEGVGPITVSGAVVSTVQVNDAGVASLLLAPSIARTWKVCDPSERPEYAFGLEQVANDPASSLHSNVLPASVEWNVKLALDEPDGFDGDVSITVSGAAVSTVHVKVAGLASVLPALSVARTSKVCEPSARPE